MNEKHASTYITCKSRHYLHTAKILLYIFLPISITNAQSANRLIVKVDGVSTYVDYRFWSNHPYLRLKDTANRLSWYPQSDGYHHIADIAACLRVDINSTNVYRISYDPLIGKSGIAGVDKLMPLAVPTRLTQNEIWIPIDLIAQRMGYTVLFSEKQHVLSVKSPKNTASGTLEDQCMQFIKKL